MMRFQITHHKRFLAMHQQRSRLAILASLISIGLWSSGFAAAHGASGGNNGGGHGVGHGHGHHRGGWYGERGSRGGADRGGEHRGWSVPGHGSYFVSIPAYCKLVYWDGVAYYYADDVYYEWSGSAGAYEQVQPPTGLADRINAQAPLGTELFVFPNGNQTLEQLERDRRECHRWADQQVGFDLKEAATRADYLRADEACLEARDYIVQ
jgi:hypothetical protein